MPSTVRHRPSATRILVRGVNWLGDAVMTTPALLRLRETFPDAHIALLTPDKLRELWFHHPAVNEAIPFGQGENVLTVSRKLREKEFDLALVLPNSPRSALEVWFAGIPNRIGYARPWRNLFLTTRVSPRPGAVKMRKRSAPEIKQLIASPGEKQHATPPAAAHQIHEYLQLAAAIGADPTALAPQLFVTAEETRSARENFGLAQTSKPILGLNPGAEYGPAKRWPAERFIAAANEIQRRTDCVWLIFGGDSDARVASQIQSAIGNRQSAFNLAGQTSLRELMSLLRLCRSLLTNDTGPMHVAAALGTPVVVPFGSTSPELTGPGPGDARHRLIQSNAPCSPCFLRECPIDFRCMNGIGVDQVVEAVVAIVEQQNNQATKV